MFPFQEQILATTKTNVETQLELFSSFTQRTFSSLEKLSDLNLKAIRASLEESNVTGIKLMAAKDPKELFALLVEQIQPNFDKALAYTRHLTNIATDTHTEFAREAETQFSAVSQKVSVLLDEATKRAESSAEKVNHLVKVSLENTGSNSTHATKNAVEVQETNHTAPTTRETRTLEKAGSSKK